MREVRIVESLKYGGRTFLYFISTVLLGGGGIALGLAVGYNAATIRGTGGDPVVYDTPELIAGVVLGALGTAVLLTGVFGLLYKLVADAVTVSLTHTGAERPEGSQASPASETAAGAVATREPAVWTDHASETADTRPSGATAAAERQGPADQHDTGTPPETEGAGGNGRAAGAGDGSDDAAEAPTGSETTPQTSESQAGGPDGGVPAAERREDPEGEVDDESAEWGPPGHVDADDGESTDSGRLSEEQIRERTAEEIAFGDEEGGVTAPDETAATPAEEADAGAETTNDPADDDTEEDELERMFSDTSSDEETEDEEPLVPEYDEIPDEKEDTDEDDPLGDPFEES